MNTNPNPADSAIFKALRLNPQVTKINETEYKVTSTSNPEITYSVTLSDDITVEGASCTCAAYIEHEPPRPYCVHRAAAHVARVQEYALRDWEDSVVAATESTNAKKCVTPEVCNNAKFLDDLCEVCLEDYERHSDQVTAKYDDFAAHKGKL